jgi:hypothetical protein
MRTRRGIQEPENACADTELAHPFFRTPEECLPDTGPALPLRTRFFISEPEILHIFAKRDKA